MPNSFIILNFLVEIVDIIGTFGFNTVFFTPDATN